MNRNDPRRCECGSIQGVIVSVPIGHGTTVAIPPTCAECLALAEAEFTEEQVEGGGGK